MTIRFVVKKAIGKRKRTTLESVRATVYVRLKDGTEVDQMCRTQVMVNPAWWDGRREMVCDFSDCPEAERSAVNSGIAELRKQLVSLYVVAKIKGKVSAEWLRKTMEDLTDGSGGGQKTLQEAFRQFQARHTMSDTRKKQYQAVERMLVRYEVYNSRSRKAVRVRHLAVSAVTPDVLSDIYGFIETEHRLYASHPDYFGKFTPQQVPKPRSKNTMSDIFKKLRTFFRWCVATGLIERSPFENFHVEGELYGTPVFLKQEEMGIIAVHNFGRQSNLARQRDVFVFQCNTGCRVGDLIRLRKTDVVNNQITYIPQKTRAGNPQTVTVPLNQTARNIVRRYSSDGCEELLPFISPQKYNAAIKQILEKAGITRVVTVLDPLSRMDKKVRICDIGSSHMARRTFAGNIYKKVKDPALVASLTGHKEGSKAFLRYRNIDDDMKRELVELLE